MIDLFRAAVPRSHYPTHVPLLNICALSLQDLLVLFRFTFQGGLFSESLILTQLEPWLMYMLVIIQSCI